MTSVRIIAPGYPGNAVSWAGQVVLASGEPPRRNRPALSQRQAAEGSRPGKRRKRTGRQMQITAASTELSAQAHTFGARPLITTTRSTDQSYRTTRYQPPTPLMPTGRASPRIVGGSQGRRDGHQSPANAAHFHGRRPQRGARVTWLADECSRNEKQPAPPGTTHQRSLPIHRPGPTTHADRDFVGPVLTWSGYGRQRRQFSNLPAERIVSLVSDWRHAWFRSVAVLRSLARGGGGAADQRK